MDKQTKFHLLVIGFLIAVLIIVVASVWLMPRGKTQPTMEESGVSKFGQFQQVTDLNSLWELLDDDSRTVINMMYDNKNRPARAEFFMRWWTQPALPSGKFVTLSYPVIDRAWIELEKWGLVAKSRTSQGNFYITKLGIQLVENHRKKQQPPEAP